MNISYAEPYDELDQVAIVAGSANLQLAEKIASYLQLRPSSIRSSKFADGEIQVEFGENIRGRDVYIVQSVCPPANDNLIELALLADAARRSSAASVNAVAPYLGYSRQDRRPRGDRTPISARVVADILTAVGVCRMITVDIHAEQIQGFYNCPVENIYSSPVLLGDISRKNAPEERPLFVSPDIGGVARARALASQFDADLAIIDKRRQRANQSEVMNIIGKARGRRCFLIDDIADTAGTLCHAADALMDRGATCVKAYCTHAILSGKAIANIEGSAISELVCTDTIPLSAAAAQCDKIRALSVAELLAETISRIHGKQSVHTLFSD